MGLRQLLGKKNYFKKLNSAAADCMGGRIQCQVKNAAPLFTKASLSVPWELKLGYVIGMYGNWSLSGKRNIFACGAGIGETDFCSINAVPGIFLKTIMYLWLEVCAITFFFLT